MDSKDLKQALDNIYEGTDQEEFMGYDPSIYDLYVDVKSGICLFKNCQFNLPKALLEYLKLVIINTKKGKFTLSKEVEDVFGIEPKSIDKMKETINKKFQKFVREKFKNNKENIPSELIVNEKGLGNKINDKINLIAAL